MLCDCDCCARCCTAVSVEYYVVGITSSGQGATRDVESPGADFDCCCSFNGPARDGCDAVWLRDIDCSIACSLDVAAGDCDFSVCAFIVAVYATISENCCAEGCDFAAIHDKFGIFEHHDAVSTGICPLFHSDDFAAVHCGLAGAVHIDSLSVCVGDDFAAVDFENGIGVVLYGYVISCANFTLVYGSCSLVVDGKILGAYGATIHG